jgi:type II secretory pathway component PulK
MKSLACQLKRSKGSVLIAVLGLVALLSAMMISFLAEATERIKFNGLLDRGSDLRERAYSGLEVSLAAIAQIAEIDDGLKSAAQGWTYPLGYADFTPFDDCELKVTVEDESAKLPLASMNESQLAAVFEELDFSASDASRFALFILDWMDSDDDARLDSMDGEDYEDAVEPCVPSNAVPRSWNEFLKIKDMRSIFLDENGSPNEKFETFKAAVSLYSTGTVNINDANPFVIGVLAELGSFDDVQMLRTLEGTDRIRWTNDDKIATSASDLSVSDIPLASFSPQLLHLRVVASRGDSHFTIDTLMKYKGKAKTSTSATIKTRLNSGYEDFPKDPASTLAYPFKVLQLTETRTTP